MKSLKYFLIVFFFTILALFYFRQPYYKTIIDSYSFLCIFSLLPFLNDFLKKTISEFNYFKNFDSYKSLITCHRYNLLLCVVNIGIANFLHFHSWSGIIGFALLIFTILVIVELYLNKNIYLPIIEKIYNKLDKSEFPSENNKNTLLYFISGLFFVVMGILFLETFVQKYYFVNDDNFSQFLPVILNACEGFFEKGLFPEINPYQFMGLPTSAVGTYALTYPVTYLSYYIAKVFFNNPLYILDVFASIHIIIAYILAFIAAKKCNVKNCYAWLVGICYCLSGFSLIASRSWYYMAPIVAYAPIIVIGLQHIIQNKKIDFNYLICGALTVALLVYAGNIQMLAYACVFYSLGVMLLLFNKQISFSKFLLSLMPIILGGILTFPQVYTTFYLLKDIDRIPWEVQGSIISKLLSVIIPNFVLYGLHITDEHWTKYNGQILYSGTIFITISFAYTLLFCILISILKNKKEIFKYFIKENIFIILGLVAVIFSFGECGYLWTILHSLPIFNKFIQPIKMVIFFDLFLIISGAIILSKIKLSKKYVIIINSLVLLLMSLHLACSNSAFFRFDYVNYPDIKPVISKIPDIQNHRIYSYSPERAIDKNYPLTLILNFSTYYKIPSINAYDNRLEILLTENIDIYKILHTYTLMPYGYVTNLDDKINKYIQEYGVKYFIVYKEKDMTYLTASDTKKIKKIENFINKNYKYLFTYQGIEYYEVDNPKPLAYDETIKALPIEFNTQGAIIDLKDARLPQKITVNMLNRNNYNAYGDGNLLTIKPDEYNRMVVDVPKGTKQLVIKYHSPWEKGVLLMLILLVVFSPIAFLLYKKAGDNE